jgi:predicted PurR-regulated permease PerM
MLLGSGVVASRSTASEPRPRCDLHVPWSTIFKVLLAILGVWILLKLRLALMVLLVATLLAVALDPAARWLESRRLTRAWASLVVVAALVVVIAAAGAFAWSSLASQSRFAVARMEQAEQSLLARFPMLREAAQSVAGGGGLSAAAGRGVQFAGALTNAAVELVFGLILTVYLLIDGRRTYQWLRGYLPRDRWPTLDATAAEARRLIVGYAFGNTVTSVFAAVCVFIGLTVLRVPAALVLAVLAGVADFVPILGFLVSTVPAVLFALMVSPATALAVVALYIAVHLLENYLIAPRVYGQQLRISDLTVLLALAVGAELGGVVGAIIALPIAAAYPSVERLWLADYLGPEVVAEHRRVEKSAGS